MGAMFGYRTNIGLGGITATSAVPSLSATNLANPHGDPSNSWQTAPGVTTASVTFDGTAGAPWRLLWLANSNLTSTAIVQWTISDNADLSAPIYESGSLTGVAARQLVHVMPAELTGRYCRMRILNSSNPDGFLRVAQVFGGAAYEMSRGLSFQSAWDRTAAQDSQETRGGQEYVTMRFQRRGWNVSFGSIRQTEWPLLDALMSTANRGGNVAFVPFPDSSDRNRDAVLGRKAPGSLGYVNGTGLYRTWSARITERL